MGSWNNAGRGRCGHWLGRGWFTLIELLVVISIVGMLVTILLPALVRARELVQTTLCAANLKQLGFGMLTYSSDYNIPPMT